MARPRRRDIPPINLDWFDNIIEVHWSGHPFLLLQSEAFMGISKNGEDWEKIVAPVNNLWHGAFGKGAFVVSNTGFPTPRVFRSNDATARAWKRVSVPFPAGTFINGIVAGNELIAICGGDPSGTGLLIAVSEDDGRTWALRAAPAAINSTINTDIYRGANLSYSGGIRGKGGKFLCYGQISSTVDPVTYREAIGYDWTVPEVIYGNPQQSGTVVLQSVLYHSDDCSDWSGPFTVFPTTYGGTDGFVTFTNPLNPDETVTVPGTDPFPIPALGTALAISNVANYGSPNNFFAAAITNIVGSSFAFSRDDGSSWSVQDSEFRNYFGNIAGNPDGVNICSGTNLAADSVFLASFGGGTFQASGPTDAAFNYNSMPVWGKEKFVSCGFTEVVTSQDGLTWVSHGNPTGSAFLHRVVY